MVGAADRGVRGSEQRGKYRGNVRRPEKAEKEMTQGIGKSQKKDTRTREKK